MTYPKLISLKHRINNLHALRMAKSSAAREREPLADNFRSLARQYIASIDTCSGEKPDPAEISFRLERGFTMQPDPTYPEHVLSELFEKRLLEYEVACDLQAGPAATRQWLLSRDRLAEGQVA